MGKDFYIDRPVRRKKAERSDYYRRDDRTMPYGMLDYEEDAQEFEETEDAETASYQAPGQQENKDLQQEFQQTSAPYSSVGNDPRLKTQQEQRGFVNNITSEPEVKNNRPNIVVDRETNLAKLQQVKEIRNAQKKSHSEYMALKRHLYRTIRSSQGRREVNGIFRQIEREMKEHGLDWGTEGFVALVHSYYPEANLSVTQPSKGMASAEERVNLREREEEKQQEKALMDDELSVATDNHDLQATKNVEGKNVLEPSKEEAKEESPSVLPSGENKEMPEEQKSEITSDSPEAAEDGTGEKETEEKKSSEEAEMAVPAAASETMLPTVDNASAILQVNQEPLPEAKDTKRSPEELSAELAARQAAFRSQVGMVRESLQGKIATQRQTLAEHYAVQKAQVNADHAARQKALQASVNSAKVEVELTYATMLVKLKAHLDASLQIADKKKEAKLQLLSETIAGKKTAFESYISQKEAEPEQLATQEGNRIQAELSASADLCINQSNKVAGRYTTSEAKEAAVKVGQESAKDIRAKIQPMKQNVLELARELKGNYSEYKTTVLAEFDKAGQQLKPLIEQKAQEVKDSLQQDFATLSEQLNQSRTSELASLDKTLSQSTAILNKIKSTTLTSLETASQRGLADIDKSSSLLLQSISQIEQDTMASMGGPGEVYLPGVDALLADATSRLSQLESEGLAQISGQTSAVSAAMTTSTENHTQQSTTAQTSASTAASAVVAGAKKKTEQSYTDFTEKTAKKLEGLEAACQELIDRSIKDIDASLEKIKEKIEAQNSEAKEKIKERTTENIEKAKMPLKDDNETRSDAAAAKVEKEKQNESWWKKGVVGAVVGVLWSVVKIVAIFVVIVIVSALIVAALAAIGLTVGIWSVIAVIGIGLLVIMAIASAVKRSEEGATGLKLVWLVVADSVGITDIYEGIMDKSISDGKELNQSAFERGDRTTTGIFTAVMTFLAVRGSIKGFRTKTPVPEITTEPTSAWGKGMDKIGRFVEGLGEAAQQRGTKIGERWGTLKWGEPIKAAGEYVKGIGESIKEFFKPKKTNTQEEPAVREEQTKLKEEEARRQKEEAEQKQKEAEEQRQKEEAERKQKEDEQKRQKEEAERKQKEAEEKRQKEETERKEAEEQQRKEEAERKQREAEQKQKEEAERKQKEAEAKRQKEEAERKQKEAEEKRQKEEAEEIERVEKEWPPKPPEGKKPKMSDPDAAMWRYKRYRCTKYKKGASQGDLLSFSDYKVKHFDLAKKGGRPGRIGGPDQVAAKEVLRGEGIRIVENVELGGKFPDGIDPNPNIKGGRDYYEVGKLNKNGKPEARELKKILVEVEAMGPNDRVIFVDKMSPSTRVVYTKPNP